MDGSAWARLVRVSRWNGSTYPSGWTRSGWWKTDRPVSRQIASGSSKPRTPGSVPK